MNTAIDFDRYDRIRPIRWTGAGPGTARPAQAAVRGRVRAAAHDSDDVADAIHALAVRGAPAIGIAAAWGVVLAARDVEAADGARRGGASSNRRCSASTPRARPR